MKKVQTISLAQIPKMANQIAQSLKGGEIFALVGPLGSGKTTFTQHFAKALKIKLPITSPTFAIMNQYPFKLPKQKKAWLMHLDLYRTKSIKEIAALGLKEIWTRPHIVTVIEWADKIKKYLPKNTKFIYFSGKI